MSAPATDPDYEYVLGYLRTRRQPTLSEVVEQLTGARRALHVIDILRDLDPGEVTSVRTGRDLLQNGERLVGVAMDRIEQVAPLDREQMDWGVYEDGEMPNYLYPDPIRESINYDVWDEIRQSLEEQSDKLGLFIFYICLAENDDEFFEEASNRFGWGVHYPRKNDTCLLDTKKFEEKLRRKNLAYFFSAIQVAWSLVDNIYITYDPLDENNFMNDFPGFDADGVRFLRQQWEQARPLAADYEIAKEHLARDPSLAKQVLRAYTASLIPNPARNALPANQPLVVTLGGADPVDAAEWIDGDNDDDGDDDVTGYDD